MDRPRIEDTLKKLLDDPERERAMGVISKLSGKARVDGDRPLMFTLNKLWHLMDAVGTDRG